MKRQCEICKNTYHTRKSAQRFCSRPCYLVYHAAKPSSCLQCKVAVKSFRKFCSRECVYAYSRGRRRSHGRVRIDSVGYVSVPTGSGTKRQHVLVWEQHNNMTVPKGWVIHHIDGNKLNNDISNLQAMTRGDHQRLHKKPRKPCKICGKPQNARELCSKHYTEWTRKTYGRGRRMPKKDRRI